MTDYAILYQYAVKAHTSLAPLSRFRGSHSTTAHEEQCCRFQSYAKTAIANEIYKRNWQSVNHIPGIHDKGPRDHGLWRLILTAYSKYLPDAQLSQGLQTLLFIKNSICTRVLVIKAYIQIKVWLLGSLTCNHRFFSPVVISLPFVIFSTDLLNVTKINFNVWSCFYFVLIIN